MPSSQVQTDRGDGGGRGGTKEADPSSQQDRLVAALNQCCNHTTTMLQPHHDNVAIKSQPYFHQTTTMLQPHHNNVAIKSQPCCHQTTTMLLSNHKIVATTPHRPGSKRERGEVAEALAQGTTHPSLQGLHTEPDIQPGECMHACVWMNFWMGACMHVSG